MPERTCSVSECEGPAIARGWCRRHYNRHWRVNRDIGLGDLGELTNKPPAARMAACAVCGAAVPCSNGRPRKYCSNACRKKTPQFREQLRRGRAKRAPGLENHRRRARHYGVEYEPIRKEAVFERDGWTCGICELPVDPTAVFPEPGAPTLDHIVPMSRGGGHVLTNVQLAHNYCNTAKGNRLEVA